MSKDLFLECYKLQETNFQDADLIGVDGLSAKQLARANLAGARLPETLLKAEDLAYVNDLAKSAQSVFLSMLLACVYAWLTIATTKDVRLLTDSVPSQLPIIGVAIPIVGFYLAAPLLLLGLYIYLHLYLQRLWEGLAQLPAVFPDRKSLDTKVYPWLLHGLVRSYMAALRQDRLPLTGLQMELSVLLAWFVVPFTLSGFWVRYLARHEPLITSIHIGLLAASVGFGILFSCLARATLRGKDIRRYAYELRGLVGGCATFGVLYVFSLGAINGFPDDRRASRLAKTDIRWWVPSVLDFISEPFANLEEENVSIKPTNWKAQSEELPLVQGGRLRGRDLRFANAKGAFLAKADLREADLSGANLNSADLQGADLRDAILVGAELRHANLRGAKLHRAKLRRASLFMTQLQRACLPDADLRQAQLYGADLQNAHVQGAQFQQAKLFFTTLRGVSLSQLNLNGANLSEAYLEGALLTWADLKDVKNLEANQVKAGKDWQNGLYSADLLRELGLPPNHNEAISAEAKQQLEEYFLKLQADLKERPVEAYDPCAEPSNSRLLRPRHTERPLWVKIWRKVWRIQPRGRTLNGKNPRF